MVCYITCALAIAFIVASLYIMLSKNNINQDVSLFDIDVYDKIVSERIKIYIISSVIGLVLGIIYIIWRRNKTQTIPLIFIYTVYPKSDYLLNYVSTNKQAKAWLDMYNQMKYKFIIGFIFGLIGYALVCWAILN
jgi:uncharacterized membrane protein